MAGAMTLGRERGWEMSRRKAAAPVLASIDDCQIIVAGWRRVTVRPDLTQKVNSGADAGLID